jgi:hypothetical protein
MAFAGSQAGTTTTKLSSGSSGGPGRAQANFGNLYLAAAPFERSSGMEVVDEEETDGRDNQVAEAGDREEDLVEGKRGPKKMHLPFNTHSRVTSNNGTQQQKQLLNLERGNISIPSALHQPMDSNNNNSTRFGDNTPATVTPHSHHPFSSSPKLSRSPSLDRLDSAVKQGQEAEREEAQKSQGTNNRRRAMTR